jgi:hypothetical protein
MGWSAMFEVPEVFKKVSNCRRLRRKRSYMDVMNFIASPLLSIAEAADQSFRRRCVKAGSCMNDNYEKLLAWYSGKNRGCHTVMFTCNFLKKIEVVQIIEEHRIDAVVLQNFGSLFTSNENRDRVFLMNA